jgi:DNA modification methylase
MDAHGFERSSGNRCLTPEELAKLEHAKIFQEYRRFSLSEIYDFEYNVKIAEMLELHGKLPTSFMLLQPQSWTEEVWTDVTRMLTLNGSQYAKGKEMHLCPMQFDIADRVIEQMSNRGDIVFDPFGGLMTVPYRAILKGRFGLGVELNPQYFLDGAAYCRAAEQKVNTPAFFDLEKL